MQVEGKNCSAGLKLVLREWSGLLSETVLLATTLFGLEPDRENLTMRAAYASARGAQFEVK